eukprot:CAMPEP_0194349874 /NCGR_PEP_ID=MMETSP0171-20130528/107332_1 /TAXON_ID=218684 /ORGANISM="Corethron pennatum, Strain L29A3" /LENGTH=146 /DNA_ID=CAMNT_0039117373 /DNA_START=1101 /DNA_END=1542 /DNA_ORIENTATION=+
MTAGGGEKKSTTRRDVHALVRARLAEPVETRPVALVISMLKFEPRNVHALVDEGLEAQDAPARRSEGTHDLCAAIQKDPGRRIPQRGGMESSSSTNDESSSESLAWDESPPHPTTSRSRSIQITHAKKSKSTRFSGVIKIMTQDFK